MFHARRSTFDFRAGATFPIPVCTVPSSMDRSILCNKVDAVRLHASYRMNLLLLKGQICVTIYFNLTCLESCTVGPLDVPMHFSSIHIMYPVSYRLPCVMYPILCPISVPCILNCVSLSYILYPTVYPVSCIQSSVLLLYLVS